VSSSPLDEQDRGAWDREPIAEGHALVRARLASGQAPGALPDSRRDQRRPHRCPAILVTPTVPGPRALRPAGPPWTRRRSCDSTGPSHSASSTAQRSRLRRLTVCRWRATTPSMPPAPNPLRRLSRSEESGAAYDRGHRAGRQQRREGVPHPSPRPAGPSLKHHPGHPTEATFRQRHGRTRPHSDRPEVIDGRLDGECPALPIAGCVCNDCVRRAGEPTCSRCDRSG
jgi:hypothetical protein